MCCCYHMDQHHYYNRYHYAKLSLCTIWNPLDLVDEMSFHVCNGGLFIAGCPRKQERFRACRNSAILNT